MESLRNNDEPADSCNDEDSSTSRNFQMNNEDLTNESMFCENSAKFTNHSEDVFKTQEDNKKECYIQGRDFGSANGNEDRNTEEIQDEEQNMTLEEQNIINEECAIRREEYVDKESRCMNMEEDKINDDITSDTLEINELSQLENKVRGDAEKAQLTYEHESDLIDNSKYEELENEADEIENMIKHGIIKRADDYQKIRKCIVIVEDIKQLKRNYLSLGLSEERTVNVNDRSDNKVETTTANHTEAITNEQTSFENFISTPVNELSYFKDHTCSSLVMEDLLSNTIQNPDNTVENSMISTVNLNARNTNSAEYRGYSAIISKPRATKQQVEANKPEEFNEFCEIGQKFTTKEPNGEARKPVTFAQHSDTPLEKLDNQGERIIVNTKERIKSQSRKCIFENNCSHDKCDDQQPLWKLERSCSVRISRLPCSVYCTLRHCSVSLYPLPRYLTPAKNNRLLLPQKMVTKICKTATKKSKKTVEKNKQVGKAYERSQTNETQCPLKKISVWKENVFMFKRSARKSTSPYKISSKRQRFCRHCLHCG